MSLSSYRFVPTMNDFEGGKDHAQNVKLLAQAVIQSSYSTAWNVDANGLPVAPAHIKTAVEAVWANLRTHRVISDYVIPTNNNEDWIGTITDAILADKVYKNDTSGPMDWEEAVMVSSFYLRYVYLTILGDICLWHMNAKLEDSNGPSQILGLDAPLPIYRGAGSGNPTGKDSNKEQKRTFFLQNPSDLRFFHPNMIRVIVNGNFKPEEFMQPAKHAPMVATPRTNNTPFAKFENASQMAVVMAGVQYKSVIVDSDTTTTLNHPPSYNQQASEGKDSKGDRDAGPPAEIPDQIQVRPYVHLLGFHEVNGDYMTFAETGGLTFVKQPVISPFASDLDETPFIPSDQFYTGTTTVSGEDSLNMLLSTTNLATISTFGELQARVKTHYFNPKGKGKGKGSSGQTDQFSRFDLALTTAQKVNWMGVNKAYVALDPSFTMIQFRYGEGFRTMTVKHYGLTKELLDYTITHNSSSKTNGGIRRFRVHHLHMEQMQQDKRERERNHKSCGSICGDCCDIVGDICTCIWCGRDGCDDDCLPLPSGGICLPFAYCALCLCCCCAR